MQGRFIELDIDGWRHVYRRIQRQGRPGNDLILKTITDAVEVGNLRQWFPSEVADQIEEVMREHNAKNT